MAVLPESMDRLDPNDPAGSLSILENYIRYMGERIEFSLRNVTRDVSAAGISSAEVYVLVVAIQNDLSALRSTVAGINGTVNGLSGTVTGLTGTVTDLTDKVTELARQVTDLTSKVTDLTGQVTDLESRVTALEAPPEQGTE